MSFFVVKLAILTILCLLSQVVAHDQQQDNKDNRSLNSSQTFQKQQMTSTMLDEVLKLKQKTCKDDSCPPWFYCDNYTSECVCGRSHHHIIHCNQTLQTSAVLDCFCVTYDERRDTTVAGACFYNCVNAYNIQDIHEVYYKLPRNISELNKAMCHRHGLNRTGPLCGECMPDTYPLAYSYNLSCVLCPDGHKNWWKFVFAAFLPLTVFYLIVLFFKINATSSHLHGYVFISQAISIPAFVRVILLVTKVQTLVNAVISLYGIWNLDFFRVLLPNICLQTTALQTLALDYAIAVYPLLLMIISYILIELHDRNFKVIVFIWKPFRFIFMFFRRNWDSRTSVIDAYATFFLLSFIKLLSVSFDILTPANLYTINSSDTTLVLYYHGSIEYFGKDHLPYAILAIIVLLVFIILPMAVLFLYPFKFFQKFLSCFPTRWYNILHTFVDSFLGCYKDGTEPGTRDCRWFAVLFLLFRALSFLIYSCTLGGVYFELTAALWLLFAIMLIVVQPFKAAVQHYNKINLFFVLILVTLYVSIAGLCVADVSAFRFRTLFIVLTCVCGITPLFYISFVVVYWLFTQRKWGKNLVLKFQAWRKGYDWMVFETDQQDLEDSLPDRIVNPDQYHEGNLSNFHSVSCESQDGTMANTY